MPRSSRWFAHDSQMRFDEALERLVDEFGPCGELYWNRLLEVRCSLDGDIVASLRQLEKLMNLRDSFGVSLKDWLLAARRERLIKARRSRSKASAKDSEWVISVTSWNTYGARPGTPEYERKKKRRQRGGNVPGRSRDAEVNVPDKTLHTDRQTLLYRQTSTAEGEGVPGQSPDTGDPDADAASAIAEKLQKHGVDEAMAVELATEFPDRCVAQLGWIDRRQIKTNRAGYLVRAIREDFAAPNGVKGVPLRGDDWTGSGTRAATGGGPT